MTGNLSSTTEQLLADARAGSTESLGRLLQAYGNYLRILAVSQFQRQLRTRVSPSDVVQETFCEAHRDFGQFRGLTIGEFLGWLRRILVNNLHRAVEQHLAAEKRTVRREVSVQKLAASLEQSTVRLEAVLPDPGRSPSACLEQEELQLQLANALAALPADYRDVIMLRHMEAMPFEKIGRRIDRTSGAARMLWLRAIKQLREMINNESSCSGEGS